MVASVGYGGSVATPSPRRPSMTDRDPAPDQSPHAPPAEGEPLPAPRALSADAGDASRRGFLQGSLLSVGAGTLAAIGAPALSHAQTAVPRTTFNHFHVAASDKTVHWGYFSKSL